MTKKAWAYNNLKVRALGTFCSSIILWALVIPGYITCLDAKLGLRSADILLYIDTYLSLISVLVFAASRINMAFQFLELNSSESFKTSKIVLGSLNLPAYLENLGARLEKAPKIHSQSSSGRVYVFQLPFILAVYLFPF